MIYSHGSNHSKGVLIMIKDDLDFHLKEVRIDKNGRYVIMRAEVQGTNFLFVNIYAPNQTKKQNEFFLQIKSLKLTN